MLLVSGMHTNAPAARHFPPTHPPIQNLAHPLCTQTTRILVTHQLQHLPSADYVLVMREGRVAERGTYEQLVRAGINFHQFEVASDLEAESEDDSEHGDRDKEEGSQQQQEEGSQKGEGEAGSTGRLAEQGRRQEARSGSAAGGATESAQDTGAMRRPSGAGGAVPAAGRCSCKLCASDLGGELRRGQITAAPWAPLPAPAPLLLACKLSASLLMAAAAGDQQERRRPEVQLSQRVGEEQQRIHTAAAEGAAVGAAAGLGPAAAAGVGGTPPASPPADSRQGANTKVRDGYHPS